MALMTELKKRMMSKDERQLIDLLCKPDEDLRFSHFIDPSSLPEARLLETEYTAKATVQAKLVRRLIAPILLERIGPAAFLDSQRIRRGVDYHGMLPRVTYLYSQMTEMNERMMKHVASNGSFPSARRIVAFGLGGSAIGALLAREIIQNQGYGVPFDIHTSYPASSHGIDADTLVVICSYSGNTEETLYAFDCAAQRTKNILIISRNGELGRLRKEYPFIEIPESDIQAPRESIGFWLTAFLFIVSSLSLAKKDDGAFYRFEMADLERVKARLDEMDRLCAEQTSFVENPAKQYAAYFLYATTSGEKCSQTDWQHPRVPVVFLDDADRAIGKRLANQFGETVEHPITLMVLCEDAHNEIESVATVMIEEKLQAGAGSRSYALISSRPYGPLTGKNGESRAVQRMEATLQTLFREHDVDFLRIETEGDSLLERKLCLLKLLDYTRAYASILRGTTPIPVIFMDLMKNRMGKIIGAADRRLLRLLTERQEFCLSLEDALSDEKVKSVFPALRHTLLRRLIDEGYLRDESGMLHLTEKGKELVER